MDLSTILTGANPILGGLLGVMGSFVTSIFNYKQKKQEAAQALAQQKFELDKIKAESERELAVIKAETEAKVKIVETQTKGAIDLSDAQAYVESQKGANQVGVTGTLIDRLTNIKDKDGASPWMIRWMLPIAVFLLALVDMLKGLMRPIITTYYVVLTTYLTAIAWSIVRNNVQFITADYAWKVVIQVVDTVLFLTVTCVTWWFADRQTSKFLQEKYK